MQYIAKTATLTLRIDPGLKEGLRTAAQREHYGLTPQSMDKKALNETEICQNYITPAITRAGWDRHTQIRREYSFTAGRVIESRKARAPTE